MKKILLSVATLAAVGAIVAGATGAFYGDVETSTGNTFTAGSIDLSIDSQAHYNGLICVNGTWQQDGGIPIPDYPAVGSDCEGTWSAKDLDGEHFFYFDDLKPGDWGENTISVHVTSNDAWLAARFIGKENADNTVVDPENDSPDENGLDGQWCGELAQSMTYTAWVDDGATDGWQCDGVAECTADSEEGNNELDDGEQVIELNQAILSEADADAACADQDNITELDTGWILLGQIPGGETHFYGISWDLPISTGNEVQTDGMKMDIQFGVEQVRNNPTPFAP